MKAKWTLCSIASLLLWTQGEASFAEIRTYTLGDKDGCVYNGLGSVDDVPVDPDWLAWVEAPGNPKTTVDFDEGVSGDCNVPFTFYFALEPGEVVTTATLVVALKGIRGASYRTDFLCLDGADSTPGLPSPAMPRCYRYTDLGWTGIKEDAVVEYTLNLGGVLGNDFLPDLQDGVFSVQATDDCVVDYAELVIPEPAMLAMLALGALALVRRAGRN